MFGKSLAGNKYSRNFLHQAALRKTSPFSACSSARALPPRKTAIKNTPQLLARYLFGDPCVHLPRTKKQSAGLFFAACGRPSCSIPRTEAPKKLPSLSWGAFFGDPCGNRTRVTGVRGRCLNRLTNGPSPASPQKVPLPPVRSFQPLPAGTSIVSAPRHSIFWCAIRDSNPGPAD